jgi:type II secretory pathway pseudopilin PulG
MKILSLLLLLALVIPSLAISQSAREKNEAAEKSWASFYSAFQSAVTKRDRVALKKMLASPFDSGGGGDYSAASLNFARLGPR